MRGSIACPEPHGKGLGEGPPNLCPIHLTPPLTHPLSAVPNRWLPACMRPCDWELITYQSLFAEWIAVGTGNWEPRLPPAALLLVPPRPQDRPQRSESCWPSQPPVLCAPSSGPALCLSRLLLALRQEEGGLPPHVSSSMGAGLRGALDTLIRGPAVSPGQGAEEKANWSKWAWGLARSGALVRGQPLGASRALRPRLQPLGLGTCP